MKFIKSPNKLDYLLKRLTILRLLYIFLFFTFVFTSYLYGLIQVDSHKLVINIIPDAAQSNNKNAPNLRNDKANNNKNNFLVDDNDYFADNNEMKKIIINLNENININNNKKIKFHESDDTLSINHKRNLKKFLDESEHDKDKEKAAKVAKLFFTIERHAFQIKSKLTTKELKDLAATRQRFQAVLHERNKEFREELKKEMEKNKENNDENADDNGGDDAQPPASNTPKNETGIEEYEINDIFITQLTSREVVERDAIIKSIRYEKHKRLARPDKARKTVKQLVEEFKSKNDFDTNDLPNIWPKFFFNMNELRLFSESSVLSEVLRSISTLPVINCSEKEKGTQIKLILVLSDGTDVLVKPMKVARDYQTPPDHFYFVDFERHHAEIAAFHVDKLLNFYRVPPTVGRVFNMTTELWQKSEQELAKTFFFSPAGNVCFTGHCSYYCDTTHAICGRPKDRMEGSVQLMLPSKPLVNWKIVSHPYRRSYNKKKKADWETNSNYCKEKVFRDVIYHSKLLLDLMDMSIFDFLIGNMDRHHYERMISLGNDTFPMHLDNGRAFGRPFQDEMSILEPIRQCCFVRYSTFQRLKYLYKNKFSKLLDESLRDDPLYPILTIPHLKSIDRRMVLIFDLISTCVERYSPTEVVIDDGF